MTATVEEKTLEIGAMRSVLTTSLPGHYLVQGPSQKGEGFKTFIARFQALATRRKR